MFQNNYISAQQLKYPQHNEQNGSFIIKSV